MSSFVVLVWVCARARARVIESVWMFDRKCVCCISPDSEVCNEGPSIFYLLRVHVCEHVGVCERGQREKQIIIIVMHIISPSEVC